MGSFGKIVKQAGRKTCPPDFYFLGTNELNGIAVQWSTNSYLCLSFVCKQDSVPSLAALAKVDLKVLKNKNAFCIKWKVDHYFCMSQK